MRLGRKAHIAEGDDLGIVCAYAVCLVFLQTTFFEGMGLHIVSVNISERTDCLLISYLHHTHFGRMARDYEKRSEGIDDRFHNIHDVGGFHFSLKFTDIFGCFCFERTDGHLDTGCQGVCLPLHPVGCCSVRRTLRSANNQALYLCCFMVI